MQHSTQVELIRRLLTFAEQRRTDMVADLSYNEVSDYLSPEQWEREKRILFRDYPLAVGFSADAARPGDYFTHDGSGVPILVVRGRGGRLNAFINACRHRNAMVVTESRGTGKQAFVCPYHSWTYDTEGRLLAITHDYGFAGLDRSRYGLVPLPVEERHGLVWVRPTPGAELGLEGHLGGLSADLAAFGLEKFVPFKTLEIRRRMNWKLMFDTFMEFYHFRWLHSGSIYSLFLDNVSAFDAFGPHVRLVGAKRTLLGLRDLPESQWALPEHALILYGIFPNSVLTVQGDHAALFSMFPAGDRVDESVLYLTTLIPAPPADESARAHWQTNTDLLAQAVGEDFAVGERLQRALSSGANTHTTYGRFEPGLDTYHQAINRALGKAGSRPAG